MVTILKKFFPEYRIASSHHIFKTPFGYPISIQRDKNGDMKSYQIKQVRKILEQLLSEGNYEK